MKGEADMQARPHDIPDKVTFDFLNDKVIWETPGKVGTDSIISAKEVKPLVLDILGEGDHDLNELVSFIRIISEDDVLAERVHQVERARSIENPAEVENVFSGTLKTVEIKATVLEQTKQAINAMMKDSGGTIGEVIDKMTIHFSPRDPTIAFPLAMGELGICLSGLAPAESKKAYIEVAAVLMASMTKEEQEKVHERAASIRHTLAGKLMGIANAVARSRQSLSKLRRRR